MPGTTTPTVPDLTLVTADPDAPLTCECVHSNPEGPCGRSASVRVTVVCIVEACDCAASVHLLCQECLTSWRRTARRDNIELRVVPL